MVSGKNAGKSWDLATTDVPHVSPALFAGEVLSDVLAIDQLTKRQADMTPRANLILSKFTSKNQRQLKRLQLDVFISGNFQVSRLSFFKINTAPWLPGSTWTVPRGSPKSLPFTRHRRNPTCESAVVRSTKHCEEFSLVADTKRAKAAGKANKVFMIHFCVKKKSGVSTNFVPAPSATSIPSTSQERLWWT